MPPDAIQLQAKLKISLHRSRQGASAQSGISAVDKKNWLPNKTAH
jgi:hypothetical protein